jgi:hypothetical protein
MVTVPLHVVPAFSEYRNVATPGSPVVRISR